MNARTDADSPATNPPIPLGTRVCALTAEAEGRLTAATAQLGILTTDDGEEIADQWEHITVLASDLRDASTKDPAHAAARARHDAGGTDAPRGAGGVTHRAIVSPMNPRPQAHAERATSPGSSGGGGGPIVRETADAFCLLAIELRAAFEVFEGWLEEVLAAIGTDSEMADQIAADAQFMTDQIDGLHCTLSDLSLRVRDAWAAGKLDLPARPRLTAVRDDDERGRP